MKLSRLALPGFVVLALVQLGAVVYQMADCAHFLKVGTPLEFACAAEVWGPEGRLYLQIYGTDVAYAGGIEKVDAYIKKCEEKAPKEFESLDFYRESDFAKYPVRFVVGEDGCARIAAYGERALAADAPGVLAYARLSKYRFQKNMLFFDVPFDYFHVRDTASRDIRRALALPRQNKPASLADYKGRLRVCFSERGRWQIEDLRLNGKTVSVPANLPPLPPVEKEKNPWER